MMGSQETFRFVRAYEASSPAVRKRVLQLAPFGRDDTHAIVELVRAEVGVLRDFDDKLRAIPASELERAVHRWTQAVATLKISIVPPVPPNDRVELDHACITSVRTFQWKLPCPFPPVPGFLRAL